MQYRSLGHSGVRVSEVGLGTDQFGRRVDRQTVHEIVAVALEEGINFIDTADIYGEGLSEEYLGTALEGHRNEVVLATKGRSKMGEGPNDYGASRYHLMNALEASLRRLRTDHIDLYQIHAVDMSTPFEETMRTLDDMVRSGKVRYIGASNYQAWQLCRCNDLAERMGWVPFITIQPHYHMLEREVERELLPYCRAFDIGVLPYFPLAAGLLTGKYKPGMEPPPDSRAAENEGARRYIARYATPENFRRIERLSEFARQRGHTLVELAIAWLLAEPLVSSVIAGVSRVEHVRPNARASEWRLDQEELDEIRRILDGSEEGE
ncbi:MAG: aldo/keto reductase [Chloroflexi bacterium]|nr:aldo/keto reductase [Chloroflexota bacterium]